jgi:uncharacterized protein (DUF1697 family)
MSERYVALLRGINVGRAKRVSMAELRSLIVDLGHTGVRTLLNSGNVIFDAPVADTAQVADRIEEALAARLHVSVQVVVLTAAELEAVVNANPLVEISDNPSRLMVSFHRADIDPRPLELLLEQDWSPEALAVGDRAIYMWCPAGVIEGRLAQAVARAFRNTTTTTRNWATVVKLHPLVSSHRR